MVNLVKTSVETESNAYLYTGRGAIRYKIQLKCQKTNTTYPIYCWHDEYAELARYLNQYTSKWGKEVLSAEVVNMSGDHIAEVSFTEFELENQRFLHSYDEKFKYYLESIPY